MDLDLTEEQLMIRQAVRDFAQKEIIPVSRQLAREKRFPWEILKKMVPLGFLGAPISQEYGGMGLDDLSLSIFMEEMGKANLPLSTTMSTHMANVGQTIEQWGTPEQKERYLPRMCRGEVLAGFAATEPNIGSDIASIETIAAKDGGFWVLNGTKIFTTNGGVAGVVLVIAQADKSRGYRGLTAFLVDRGTQGFTTRDIHGKLGLQSSNTAELIFDGCRLPQNALLGGEIGSGFRIAMSALDRARLCCAAQCVGVAQACIDAAVEYAKNRIQFGKPIGGHQLIQEIISDMIVETEAARFLTYRAAYARTKGNSASTEISKAKYYASEVVFRVANNALQVHGGYGYIDDFPVERYLRDIRIATIWDGTSQIQTLLIARDALDINAFS
ncbi:MAG: acyl-CoA dehydrogenase family protein [Chloroflexi bacterium]|nr:acyl-CoA dehydrogenase family protein [Chloroflexota bacterium]